MAQIFHPSFNTFSKASVFGALGFVVLLLFALGWWVRSDYWTGVGVAMPQPVPFSHQHHAGGLGIDCRYCHWPVETSPFAGVPGTSVCMGCHRDVWNDAPVLAPVRQSFADDIPLSWTRVHDLPDFAYFHHAIHIAKGVGCEECHGRVDLMPLVQQAQAFTMEFCLDCHRNPGPRLRPPEHVFEMGWTTEEDRDELGRRLIEQLDVRVDQLDDCSICHR